MYKNHYFLEAQLFSSPLRSSECSDYQFSPSKKQYSEDEEDMALSDDFGFSRTLYPCELPWRKLDYPINFEMDIPPDCFSQFHSDSNLIENPNVQQHHQNSTFVLKNQGSTSVIDGFANMVDQVSSFYINKLNDGKSDDDQKETILRKTIQKRPMDFDEKHQDGLTKKQQFKTLKRTKPSKQPFSKEEDLEIVKYHQIYKGNWDQISKFIPNRKPYLLKNRFYSHIRKNLSQFTKELENLGKKASIEKDDSTDMSEVETGVVESDYLKSKSPSEAIEILSSKISFLTNLYNQTKVELIHLQKDPHLEIMARN